MPFTIVRDDLKERTEDAIAVSTNEQLVIDGGNGLAVASKVGLDSVQRACSAIGGCKTGNAITVDTGRAGEPIIIFAVGPVWRGGNHGEPAALRDAVASVLRETAAHHAQSVALPLIATGAFGFPPELAFQITTSTITSFLQSHEMDVTLVLFDREAVRAAVDYGEIERFIDDNYVDEHGDRGRSRERYRFDPMTGEPLDEGTSQAGESSHTAAPMGAPLHEGSAPKSSQSSHRTEKKRRKHERRLFKRHEKKPTKGLESDHLSILEITPDALESSAIHVGAPIPDDEAVEISPEPTSWEEYEEQDEALGKWLERRHDSFTTTLLKMIDIRGMADVDVYKRANMSRQLFSKIRSDVDYRPKKKTVIALAIALELSLAETRELLDCAGYSLSQSSRFDLIIEYFIRQDVYDCFAINEALFAFGEELLS